MSKKSYVPIIFFSVVLSATGAHAGQCGSVDQASPGAVRSEVNRLFDKTLDDMEYVLPSGVKVSTWRGWQRSTEDQIRCLGVVAVPATAELLRSTTRSFGHLLAIHMLSWEGGPEIVPPLADVLNKPDNHPERLDTVRLAAIEALAAAPPEIALPVVEQVLSSEKNPDLLKAAERVKERLTQSH